MKKWLYLTGALAALGLLTRLPHPARDISGLEPVRAVYVTMTGSRLRIETDTGDSGTGASLGEAAADMKAKADQEIFLDTAEFLLLDPRVSVTEEFYTLLRPGCRVCAVTERKNLSAAADYLAAHKPKTTLARIRAGTTERSRLWGKTQNSIRFGSWQRYSLLPPTGPTADG